MTYLHVEHLAMHTVESHKLEVLGTRGFIMPPKSALGAYSFLTVSPSQPYSCQEHIFYIICGKNSKFDLWIHLKVLKCHILFSGHCDLDLWPQF